jgi:hypothetical protein
MGMPSAAHLTANIQELLDQNPFESAQSMAEALQVPHSMVLKYLRQDLLFQSFHFRSILHLLTPDLREQRRGYASEMIPILTAAGQDGWHHLVAGDESWFFCPVLHAECGPSPEMTSLPSVNTVFTRHNSCSQSYGIHWDSMLSINSQLAPK